MKEYADEIIYNVKKEAENTWHHDLAYGQSIPLFTVYDIDSLDKDGIAKVVAQGYDIEQLKQAYPGEEFMFSANICL